MVFVLKPVNIFNNYFPLFQMIPLNTKLLGAILLFALITQVSSQEEKKVMRRRKVLPSPAEVFGIRSPEQRQQLEQLQQQQEPEQRQEPEQHYRVKKQMKTPPAIRDGKSTFFFCHNTFL
jgi:hypothetical protein